jgi:hypothetical protein
MQLPLLLLRFLPLPLQPLLPPLPRLLLPPLFLLFSLLLDATAAAAARA